jgi:hypothetical protein
MADFTYLLSTYHESPISYFLFKTGQDFGFFCLCDPAAGRQLGVLAIGSWLRPDLGRRPTVVPSGSEWPL